MPKSKNNNVNLTGKPFDFILVSAVLIMLLLGLVMVLSASAPSALAEDKGSYAYVKTQGISAIIRISFYVCYIQNRL